MILSFICRIAFFAAAFLSSSRVIAAPKVIVHTSPGDWNDQQIQLIHKAATIVATRMPNTRIAKCAFRNSTRGAPTQEKWAKQMATMRRGKTLELTIVKDQKKGALGRAKVNTAVAKKHKVGFQNIEIKLGGEYVRYGYRQKNMKSHADVQRMNYLVEEFWAKTIAHEIGHALGYIHGTGQDFDKNYKGYFVTELGLCVYSDGRSGSGDEDRSRRGKPKDSEKPRIQEL